VTPSLDQHLAALQSDDPLSQLQACDALIQIGDPALPALHDLLNSPHVEICWRVIITLGWIASQRSRRVIMNALNKQGAEWAVRHSAVWALGRIENTIVTRKLLSVLVAADTEEQIRYVAAMGLLTHQRPYAEEAMRLALDQKDENLTCAIQSAIINPHFRVG
jgi:HEAT repeat protein